MSINFLVCGLFEMVVKGFFVCRSGVGVQRKPVDWISPGCQSMFTLLFQNIHYPQGRYKVLPKEMTKPIHYPVSLIPGQFQNYFKRYLYMCIYIYNNFITISKGRGHDFSLILFFCFIIDCFRNAFLMINEIWEPVDKL